MRLLRSFFVGAARFPKHLITFVITEYFAPLGDGERLLLLTTLLASLVSAYGVQAHLAGAYGAAIGWVGAGAIELAYIGGALTGSAARHNEKGSGGSAGAWASMIIAALLAVFFNLAYQVDVRGSLDFFATAEAVGFPLLALVCAVVAHRVSGARQVEAQRIRTRDEERRQIFQDERLTIELEDLRARKEIERKQFARSVRVNTQPTVQPRLNGLNGSGERNREQDKRTVRERLREHPGINRSQLMTELGLKKTYFYSLLKELQEEEEKGEPAIV